MFCPHMPEAPMAACGRGSKGYFLAAQASIWGSGRDNKPVLSIN